MMDALVKVVAKYRRTDVPTASSTAAIQRPKLYPIDTLSVLQMPNAMQSELVSRKDMEPPTALAIARTIAAHDDKNACERLKAMTATSLMTTMT